MYQLYDDGSTVGVIYTPTNTFIPSTPAGSDDWLAYLSWLAAGNTPDAAAVESLAQAKARKEAEMRATAAASIQAIVSPYTLEERETWFTQVKEAEAYTANNAASTPFIDAIIAARGVTKAEQVNNILTKKALYEAAVGAILGRQQNRADQITAATTTETVNAIVW